MWGPAGWEISVEGAYGGGGGGGGGSKLVALSLHNSFTNPGAQVLFAMHFKIIKSCNFILETPFYFDLVKLSDKDWQPILPTKTNGQYHMDKTVPDLEFELVDTTPTKPFEFCKTFQIKVYVTHICANLKDYNLVILYDTELLKLTGVDWTDGVLGGPSDGASYTELLDTVTVVDTGGIVWSGLRGLLFTLTFHVEFDDRKGHIWHTNPLYDHLHAFIKFTDATLSFEEGIIPMSGITMPSDLDIIIKLIRGDVDCDGNVDVFDLRCVANFYDQSEPAKYDLTMDGTIDIFDLVAVATNIGYPPP
jgi:hypothetical protein